MLRDASPDDAAAICRIYNHYIRNTTITFEEEALSEDAMRQRLTDTLPAYPWLVYERAGSVLGYAYASQWKPRGAFRHTVESSLYLDHQAQGGGIGSLLYRELLDRLRQLGFHLVVGAISLPNDPSIRLHRKFGFTRAGKLSQAGFKFDRWIDVEYWELMLSETPAD